MNVEPVTDASFVRVFSQMKLREFRFESREPLEKVGYHNFWKLKNFIAYHAELVLFRFCLVKYNMYTNFPYLCR